MERTLSLILDETGLISLTLMKADADIIDTFTSKNFENSDQIREKYKNEIDKYLLEKKSYIEAIERSSGKLFRGRIVILEAIGTEPNMMLCEKRVLYKKHLIAFKTIVKDEKTMQRFVKMEHIGYNENGFRRLISPFLSREIKYTNFKIKTRIDFIIRELRKGKTTFYDNLRIICKAYEIERKQRKTLKTIDALYKEYLESNPGLEKKDSSSYEINEEDQYIKIDGFSYSISDRELFDIEKMKTSDNFRPDGLGEIKLLESTKEIVKPKVQSPQLLDTLSVDGQQYDVFDMNGLEQLSFKDDERKR